MSRLKARRQNRGETPMAFTDRSSADRKRTVPSGSRAPELLALILLAALVAALALRDRLALDALAPVIATSLFGLAGTTAGLALLVRRDRLRGGLFDIAGTLTFAGVAISILIEPDQMVRLTTVSEQPD